MTITRPPLPPAMGLSRFTPPRITPATVFGELTTDGKHIVITVSGDPWVCKHAVAALRAMTPQDKPVGDGAATLLPLTWPTYMQLACTFTTQWSPGGRLREWFLTELARRTQWMDRELRYKLPTGLALREWQPLSVRNVAHLGCLLEDSPRLGKFLRNDQPILTPTGWTEIGKLCVGDKVIGSNGQPAKVTGVYPQGIQHLYAVTTDDGITVIAGADHLWVTETSSDRRRGLNRWKVRTTDEIAATLTISDGLHLRRTNHYLPMLSAAVDGPHVDLPLDPWLIGVLIGDGCLTCGQVMISKSDTILIDRVQAVIPPDARLARITGTQSDYRITGTRHKHNPVLNAIRELNLHDKRSHEKFIPEILMHASAQQRHAVLTGLLDTDDSIYAGRRSFRIEYGTTSPMLAEHVAGLVHSLGGTVRTYHKPAPSKTEERSWNARERWQLYINLPTEWPPFGHSIKRARYEKNLPQWRKRPPRRTIVSITPVADDFATCISVDAPDHLYTTTGCVLTHNSASAIVGLAERACWPEYPTVLPVVVVCPASVVTHWVREFQRFAPHWRTVAWRGGNSTSRAQLIGHYDVYVASYATARRDASHRKLALRDSPLSRVKAHTIIADEYHFCVPKTTLIETPSGPRRIVDLQVGDKVIGVDHTTGNSTITPVLATMSRRYTGTLANVHGVSMTPKHPVWTTRGYVPAQDICPGDKVCEVKVGVYGGYLCSQMRILRADNDKVTISQQTNTTILQPQMLREVSRKSCWSSIKDAPRESRLYSKAICCVICKYETLASEPRIQSKVTKTSTGRHQPIPQPFNRNDNQTPCHITEQRIHSSIRRQWARFNRSASTASSTIELADRSGYPHQTQESLANLLQSGHSLTRITNRHRGRWPDACNQTRETPRPQKRYGTHRTWLDCITLSKSASTDASSNRTEGDHVYNIETGTGNYIANGLLIHNCASDKALQTKATQRLVRETNGRNGLFIPLSGTPFTHNVSNAHPTWEVFEPRAFPSRERLVDRWLDQSKQDYGQKITGINPLREAEFRACFLGRQLRRSREDVAPWLSTKTYSTREIPIPDPYRKMYRDMERKMLAELDNGDEVTVMSTVTKMMRLQQLAASACDLSETITVDEDTGLDVIHQHLHPKLPSWKVDALLDVLAELEWPALAFGISRPLMELAGAEATRAGARVGYVIGGQRQKDRDRDIDAFQAGKLDLLCVVVQAGGTGLTLNAAGSEIFLQRPCSFVHSIQAEDRGVGDRYPTLDVVDIVAEKTVDLRIREILHEKAAQLSEYFADMRIVRQLFGGTEQEA